MSGMTIRHFHNGLRHLTHLYVSLLRGNVRAVGGLAKFFIYKAYNIK